MNYGEGLFEISECYATFSDFSKYDVWMKYTHIFDNIFLGKIRCKVHTHRAQDLS
jgi:hypothetical protein